MLRFLSLCALLLLLPAAARARIDEPAPVPTPVDVGTAARVRVLVYQGAGPVLVAGPEGIVVEEEGFPAYRVGEISLPPEAEPVSTATGRHWSLSSPGAPLQVEGRAYRGELEVWYDGRTVQVVNCVGLEDYLRGVVPRELLSSQVEAVKAQAVVARTYALAHLQGPEVRWDVRDDTGHQVYGGVAA